MQPSVKSLACLAMVALFVLVATGWVAAPFGFGTARPEGCGNGVCDGIENYLSCPQDCTPKGGSCGDYICDPNSENKTTCPQDCGNYEVCGDNTCIGSEDAYSCPLDCGLPKECGNGVCDTKENSYNCPVDCGFAESCGNGVCDLKENYYNCLADCKRTQYRCGDGLCDGRENVFNCPLDCGTPSTCGNNVCDPPYESMYNCPGDCGQIPSCGNGKCDDQENSYNCARDCVTIAPGASFESATLVKDGIFDRKYTKNNVRDFFKLDLLAGEKLIVTSTCKPLYWGPSHHSSPSVSIYDDKKDLLAKKSVSLKEKNDAKDILVSWATAAGKKDHLLYVEVGPDSVWEREFSCTTKFEVVPLLDLNGKGDAPPSVAGAFEVKPGLYEENWLVGGDEGADEKDFYTIHLGRADKLEVTVIPGGAAQMSLQFYDEKSKPLDVKPFASRDQLVGSYVATESGTVYFSVSRVKSGRYAFSVAVQKVDLCYYVKCGEGEQCLNGACVKPGQETPASGQPSAPSTTPSSQGFPTEREAPRAGLWESLVSFVLGLFGMK